MLWQPTWWMINDDQCLKYFASLTRCAKHFWSALLKDRARDMFLPCRFCKKTEIAQIRLPWGRHDFSLQFDFSGINSFSRRAAEPTGEKEHSPPQIPPWRSITGQSLFGWNLSFLKLAIGFALHRKLWHEGARIYDPETFSRSRLQNCCKTVINPYQSHGQHTQVSRVML